MCESARVSDEVDYSYIPSEFLHCEENKCAVSEAVKRSELVTSYCAMKAVRVMKCKQKKEENK